MSLLEQAKVVSHIGEKLTARELKKLFDYSPSTFIKDTVLWKRKWLRYAEREDGKAAPFLYEIVQGQPF